MRERVPISRYWPVVVISVAMAVGLNIALLFLDIAQYSDAYQQVREALYSPPFAQQIILYGICVPVIEEVFFRGIIFKWLRRKMPFVWAMIISAVVFGLYHGNLVQFVYAGIMGLLLAWLYEKYDSIMAPMASHVVMNVTVNCFAQVGLFFWILNSTTRVLVSTLVCAGVATGMYMFIHKMDVTKMLKKYCKHVGDVI